MAGISQQILSASQGSCNDKLLKVEHKAIVRRASTPLMWLAITNLNTGQDSFGLAKPS